MDEEEEEAADKSARASFSTHRRISGIRAVVMVQPFRPALPPGLDAPVI